MARGKIIAGIDVGTDKVCTIIASQHEETGKLNVIGVAATPSKGLKKSQVIDIDEAISAITDSVEASERMAGYNISQAWVSISGSHISAQNSKGVVAVAEPEGEINHTDVARVIEAAKAIALPSQIEIIHVIPRDYSVDAQIGIKDPVGMTGVRLEAEAHLITGASTWLKNIEKCITELGISVNGLVYSGLASSESVLTETERELGVILVDIGAGTTAISAYVEGALAHSSVIPIGAKNITNDLAIGMRINLSDAEKIKLYLSQTDTEPPPPRNAKASEIAKVRKDYDTIDLVKLGIKEDTASASRKALIDGIIRPRLKEIFVLVAEKLKTANLIGQTPAGIVITGGGAQTVQILDTAKRTLSLPARIGIPKGLTGLVDELGSPAFATSAGLILYGSRQNVKHTSSFKTPNFMGAIGKVPVRGVYDKAISFIKSLLP